MLDSAQDEIENISDYIADDSIDNALRWYDHIKEKIQSLETMPDRCPKAPESELVDFVIFHLIVGNYRVLYRIEGDTVQVLHVRGWGQENKL